MGFGSIAGPLAGGFLVDFLGWRSLFLFSVLAGIIIVALGVIILDPNRFAQDNQRGHGRKFHWPGSVLCGGTILILLLAITNGHRIGWASTPMIGATVLFSALLGTFSSRRNGCFWPRFMWAKEIPPALSKQLPGRKIQHRQSRLYQGWTNRLGKH